MRTEECVCGGLIVAPSLRASAPYVEAHGRSVRHGIWRARHGDERTWLSSFLVELVNVRPIPYRDPRRPTTDTATVTCPAPSGASAGGGAE
jgi:hypothetical protein